MSTLSQFFRHGRPAAVLAAALFLSVGFVGVGFVSVASVNVASVNVASAQAQPAPLRMSLDWRLEGPLAMFLVAQERGYFREEGLDVAIDEGAVPLDPISRVASGSHDIGFADINALIRYRDQHPNAAVKAVFMVYNRPPYSIVSRKSRGVTEPKPWRARKSAYQRTAQRWANGHYLPSSTKSTPARWRWNRLAFQCASRCLRQDRSTRRWVIRFGSMLT